MGSKEKEISDKYFNGKEYDRLSKEEQDRFDTLMGKELAQEKSMNMLSLVQMASQQNWWVAYRAFWDKVNSDAAVARSIGQKSSLENQWDGISSTAKVKYNGRWIEKPVQWHATRGSDGSEGYPYVEIDGKKYNLKE